MNYLRLNFLNIQQISFNQTSIYGIIMAKAQLDPQRTLSNFSLDDKLERVRWGSPLSVACVNQHFGPPSKIVEPTQSLFDKNLQGLNPISKEEKKIMNDAREAHNSIFFNPDHSKDHPKVCHYAKEINRFIDIIRNNGHINPVYPEDMFQILLSELRILAPFCEDESLDTFNTACNYFQEIFEIVKKAFSLVNDGQLRIKDISEQIIFIIEQANFILVIKDKVNDEREERAAQKMLSYILTRGDILLSSLVSIECRMNISFETDINNGILLSDDSETDSSPVLPLSEYPGTDNDDDFLSSESFKINSEEVFSLIGLKDKESEELEELISNIFCLEDDGLSYNSLTVENPSRCQNPKRREKIDCYHRKRRIRNWEKGPRYNTRAELARSRPRKKGRFVAKKDE
jgi:hypothetical protein